MSRTILTSRQALLGVLCAITQGLITGSALAAAPPAGFPPPPPPPPIGRAGELIDLSGTWVPLITQDWRHRMMTVRKGDYESVPLTPEGRRVADGWDLDADNAVGLQCKPFGAPAIARQPGRLRISWEDQLTLNLEFDAGTQVRRLKFSTARGDLRSVALAAAPTERTWQGYSAARWFKQPQRRGFQQMPLPQPDDGVGGSLEVETVGLRAGYLRKNGVPYSENARLSEYFDRFRTPDGQEWLLITTVVDDPEYLREKFFVSTQFRRERDASKWQPTPCTTDPPLLRSAR